MKNSEYAQLSGALADILGGGIRRRQAKVGALGAVIDGGLSDEPADTSGEKR